MMKAMPLVRRQMAPTASASSAPASSATPTWAQPFVMPANDSIPTAYAPTPMYMAWPKLTSAP